MEIWCGVKLRDVNSAILTTHKNECIHFHIRPITTLLRTSYNHNKLNIYYLGMLKTKYKNKHTHSEKEN